MLIYVSSIPAAEGRAKFEQVYRHYRGLMYEAAFRLLGSEEDAEDAVHQAFLYLAENISKISEPICTKTRSYVVIIVKSKSLDMLRRRKRRPTVELGENTPGLSAALPEGRGLAAAIAKLPGRERELILLKYAYGYTNSECAKLFGLSYHGIHSLDQRAKNKLRQLLQEEGIDV